MSYGTQPGPYASPNAPGAGAPIKNWMTEAIIVTVASVCCAGCWPIGVIAIVFASQVNSKLAAGDRAGAEDAAGKAKLFTIIAAVFIVIGLILTAILFATGAIGGAMADPNMNM